MMSRRGAMEFLTELWGVQPDLGKNQELEVRGSKYIDYAGNFETIREPEADTIRLGGRFTLRELEAILALVSPKPESLPGKGPFPHAREMFRAIRWHRECLLAERHPAYGDFDLELWRVIEGYRGEVPTWDWQREKAKPQKVWELP